MSPGKKSDGRVSPPPSNTGGSTTSGGDGNGMADDAAADFAFYFKPKNDMMRKLETSKPVRSTKAAGKKKPGSPSKASTEKGSNADDGGQTYLFRWQRDAKPEDKESEPGVKSTKDDDDDDDDEEGLPIKASTREGPSVYQKMTGNLPPSALSISIYVGKQDGKNITPKMLNQALYHSGKAKGTVASPQSFEKVLEDENGGPQSSGDNRAAEQKKKMKKTKSFGAIDLDQFGASTAEDEDEYAPEVAVLKLRKPVGWPPLPPRFPPPPPEENEAVEPKRVTRVIGSGGQKQGGRKKSIAGVSGGGGGGGGVGGSSGNARVGGSISEKGSLAPLPEFREEEKKPSGWRRRLSFMPGTGRTSNLASSQVTKLVYTTTCKVPWVIPPPPDPPRPPRPGSNDERKQAEQNLMFMFVEDMYSQLLELQHEKLETSTKCAELEEQISQAEETIAAMLAANESLPESGSGSDGAAAATSTPTSTSASASASDSEKGVDKSKTGTSSKNSPADDDDAATATSALANRAGTSSASSVSANG